MTGHVRLNSERLTHLIVQYHHSVPVDDIQVLLQLVLAVLSDHLHT